jgi:YHS domain-containing protein/thiol-disulfide isomerase/thioredoxin
MAVRRIAFIAALILPALLSTSTQAQTEPIAWHSNIESAKAAAKQNGKLVLVHFWTEDCAPCVALERNVFSQPEVANAIQAQFVPVKLNANANQATASQMGVTRVPMDVVLTPDGQMVGRLISPGTPMAYVGELSQVAARFQGQSGQGMAGALANAPQPSNIPAMTGAPSAPQVSSVYAGLNVQNAATPVYPKNSSAPTSQVASIPVQPVSQAAGDRYATNPPFGAPALPGITQQQVQMNAAAAQMPVVAQPQITQPPQGASPMTVDNRYGQSVPTVNSYAGQPVAGQTVTNQFASVQNAMPPTAPITNTQPVQTQLAPAQPPMNPAANQAGAMPAGAANFMNSTSMVASTTTPDPRRLPAGSPPLGFDGFCPVSMRGEWKWVSGNPQFGAIHRGRTYWFAGPTQQQQFLANPDYYSPALSGIDPVLAIEHRQQVPGKREHSIDYDNLFYMFASEASLQQFTANPERYAAGVRAAMGIQRGRAVR